MLLRFYAIGMSPLLCLSQPIASQIFSNTRIELAILKFCDVTYTYLYPFLTLSAALFRTLHQLTRVRWRQ